MIKLRHVRKIWLRQLPTATHKEAWSRFERIASIRAIICATAETLYSPILLTYMSRKKLSLKFLEDLDQDSLVDRELVATAVPYLHMALISLWIITGIILISSCWRLKMSNALFYLKIMTYTVSQCMPANYGDFYSE